MKKFVALITTICICLLSACNNTAVTSGNTETSSTTDTSISSVADNSLQQTSSIESSSEKQPQKFVYDEKLSVYETIEIIKEIVAEFPEAWTFEQVHEIFGEPDEAGGSGMYREKYLFGDLRVDFINPTPYMITVRYPDANGEYKIEVIKYPE